jgi:predicted CXXCH cytochrome family protein
VNYIVGSGQHTNSHLKITNGYLSQMPMTFYTQKKRWDLPPGFENGVNTRFSRKIGLECMSCHNAFPEYVLGSENKYSSIGKGIDCERCHGPGSAHVAQRQTGSKIDTSKYIDYSIVNPAKLSIDAQFDICQRCHLQGNTVLKEGKSFFDFKPGQKLSDYMSVFLPKYKNADKEFIMASHADRLKQSACFIKSYEKVKAKNALKPYKDAMTCITCHNPHISVRETNKNTFNEACINCHKDIAVEAGDKKNLLKSGCGLFSSKMSNCTSCNLINKVLWLKRSIRIG